MIAAKLLVISAIFGCGAKVYESSSTIIVKKKDSSGREKESGKLPSSNPAKSSPAVEHTNSETASAAERTSTENASQTLPEKRKRDPIYNPEASGTELIAAAIDRAKRNHKHVLIEWGGNWCGWCHLLHDVFVRNEIVRPIVYEEFELVLVDSRTNQELLEHYAGKDQQFSYPHLTVLDSDGQVLTNQNTEPLEEGPAHNPKVVAEFLKKWAPAKIDAQ